MRDVVKGSLCFALVFGVVLFSGCGKKENEKPASADTAAEVVEEVKVSLEEAKVNLKEAKVSLVEEAKVSLEVDINKDISAIRSEVGKLDVAQLTTLAKKYKAIIDEKKVKLDTLKSEVKGLDAAAMFSEDGLALMVDMDRLSKATAALKERFSIYYNKLKALGGDVSGLEVD